MPSAVLVGADPENLGFVDLAWSAPGADGGSPISSFALEVSVNIGSTWDPVALLPSTALTYSHFCGLPAVSCIYRISAGNAVGLSAPSVPSETVITQAPPDAPGAPVALPLGDEPDPDGLIDVSWGAPGADGGSPVAGYQVQVSKDGGTSWHEAATVDAFTTNIAVACGASIVTCVYRVAAVNAVGRVAAVGGERPDRRTHRAR